MESVAIIGAGPAGSTLTALLAGRGVDVTLYDRDAFPRDKLCGEFLSYDALPVLEPLGVVDEIDQAGAPRIEHCRVVGSKRTYEFAFPHAARGVSRFYFDDLLHRIAQQRGARASVNTVNELPDAKVIVGAWGRWGRFDQQLGRKFVRDHSHRNFGFKRHYRSEQRAAGSGQEPSSEIATRYSLPAARSTDSISLYSFKRGYLGVNAVEGGITNICGLVHASRLAHHKGKWDAFIENIRAEEPQLEELYARHEPAQDGYLSSEPVIFRARSAVEGGVFMIGDASGVIDPLTGNGMAMAIQSALLLAPHIVRLLEQPARRGDIEDEYRHAHRKMFLPRIAWSRRVASLLSRPRLLDAALMTTSSPRIGKLLLRHTRASRDEIARLADAWFC